VSVYTTSDKPMDEVGVGTAIRLKAKGTLSSFLTDAPREAEPKTVYVPYPVYIPTEPALLWSSWWAYTRTLITYTWRKFFHV